MPGGVEAGQQLVGELGQVSLLVRQHPQVQLGLGCGALPAVPLPIDARLAQAPTAGDRSYELLLRGRVTDVLRKCGAVVAERSRHPVQIGE